VADWDAVIGLEVHAQLKTRTKMFCRCANEWGAEPNTRTCPVCLAYPGALPVLNGRAVEWAIKLGLALGCEVASHGLFHRKNYFYFDNPKGYQISQYDSPICAGGSFTVPGPDGEPLLIELEVTEPFLFLMHDPPAADRFASAVTDWLDTAQ